MDILKVGLSIYLIIIVIGMALTIANIGRPREPMSGRTAAGIFIFNIPFFVMFLVIWTRL